MSGEAQEVGEQAGERRASIAFLNLAHAIDHYVLLIFPTVVIGLESVYGRSYGELIALSTAAFVIFGLGSLPAGWLADRWSRRNMMALFYFGCGASLAGAGLAPTPWALAFAMTGIGLFAAIYHPVGLAMLIDITRARPRSMAFNGVCGNLGVALAAGVSAALASWFGWRSAFLAPAFLCLLLGVAFLRFVPNDTHRTGSRKTTADVRLSPRAAVAMFMLYFVLSLAGGFIFNTITVAMPKIVDERLGQDIPLIAVGGLATAIFLCGAAAQIVAGRLLERVFPPFVFASVAAVQFLGILWAAHASGLSLIAALALTMIGIYGQVTAGDIVLARYTADAWRGRIYAVRFFLTFLSSGIAVSAIAWLHGRGGFDLVLLVLVVAAAIMLATVLGFVALVTGAESARAADAPAE